MQPLQQLVELRLALRRRTDHGDERRGALEAACDVRREQPQPAARVGLGRERSRASLIGHRPCVGAAHRASDELAEQVPLRPEVAVDRLLRDPGGLRDRGDARALVAALPEEVAGGGENTRPGLLGLLAAPR